MKVFRHILRIALVLLLLAVPAGFVAMQLPRLQTSLVKKVVSELESKTDARLCVGKIHVRPLAAILLKDVVILDSCAHCCAHGDTLGFIGSLSVRYSPFSLLRQDGITLRSARLRNVTFNLVIEGGEDYNTNIQRVFRLKTPQEPKGLPDKHILSIDHVDAENLHFTMTNLTMPDMIVGPEGIDWADFDLFDANLKASDFSITRGMFFARIDGMSFSEKSGWRVRNLKCHGSAGRGRVVLDDVELTDDDSFLKFDYRMTGNTIAYSDYVNKVRMDINMKSSRVSLRTLARFIPRLNPDRNTFALVSGHCSGTVSDLRASGMNISFENSSIRARLDGNIAGLPDINASAIDARLSGLRFTTRDATSLVRSITGKNKFDITAIAPGVSYSANIAVSGLMNDMNIHAKFDQGPSRGWAQASVNLRNVLATHLRPLSASGWISTGELDIDAIMPDTPVQNLSMTSGFSVTLQHGESPIDARADSLKIANVTFKDLNFKDIKGSITFQGRDLTAEITSSGKTLDADFAVWSDKYSYNGSAVVRNVDLSALGIDRRELSRAGMNIYARLDKDLKPLQGNADITNIFLTNANGSFHVSDMAVNAANKDSEYDITLESETIAGNFKGNLKSFESSLQCLDYSELLAFISPGIYIENGSTVNAAMDTTGFVRGTVSSPRVAYYDNYIKDLHIDVSGPLDSLQAELTAPSVLVGNYRMDNSVLKAQRQGEEISATYSFSNAEGNPRCGHLAAGMILKGKGRMDIRIQPSSIVTAQSVWEIPSSHLNIDGENITVDNFIVRSNDQWLKVDGKISADKEQELHADIRNFDVSPINALLGNKFPTLGGVINASGCLYSPVEGGIPDVEMNMMADSLTVGGILLGKIYADSKYNEQLNHFDLFLNDKLDGKDILSASAIIMPQSRNIEALASFESFPIGFVQPMVPTVFSALDGNLSGNVMLEGPLDSLNISSKGTRIDSGMLKVDYTGVPYFLEGDFSIDNGGVHLGKIEALDRFGSKASVKGDFKWNRFKDIAMDLRMAVRNIEALNLSSPDNGKVFYGNMFGSGIVNIYGPMGDLTLEADVRTVKGSDLHIVIPENMDASRSNLLTFVSPVAVEKDPYDKILEKYRKSVAEKEASFNVKLHAMADPSLRMNLDLGNTALAAGLSGNGNGDISISANSSEFSILGDYILQEGTFGMNVNNIVRRNFEITEGSSIKFNGDIMASTVSLDAIYDTKASIASLISDTTSVSNRRLVRCGINIVDKLSNPTIKFDIKIPDLEPSVKSKVESALSTEDKMQKQFLSLLLSGNFLPDEQNGIVNNSSLLYSNVSEIMANQINNIFNKLNIPLDLGLNYQPSETGKNLFDVALSTQLFDNRVIIGGTLGNRFDKAGNGANTFFGDLDIQYKVNRSGTFRIKAFSHSADQYSNYLDNSQRNGLGMSWQQDFDNFGTWIKNLFAGRKAREAQSNRDMLRDKKQKTIEINE